MSASFAVLAALPSGLLGKDITVGDHIKRKFLGLTFNVDTVYATLIAGAIVVILGFIVRRGITSGTPNKLQLLFETVVDAVQTQVKQSVGPIPPFVVPLAVSLFTFILVANWIELIPSGHHPEVLPAPTADVNLTLALALMVTALFTMTGIRHKGFFHYTAGFFKPLPLFFIKIIEEIAKPLSLALRLFGNVFAGGVMISVITLFPAFILPVPNVIWKSFDMFIGLIQACIFALLTILYFTFAVEEAH